MVGIILVLEVNFKNMRFFEGFFSGNKEEEKPVATEGVEEETNSYKELMMLEDQIEKANNDPEFAETIDRKFIEEKIANLKERLNIQ